MIADITAIFWKEWREILSWGGGRSKLGVLAFAVVFGVVLPLQSGRGWITSPASLLVWLWVPFFMVSGTIADAIAGERERHTLETLLASRLSDSAILLGKTAAAASYGLALTWVSLILGVVTVNVANASSGFIFYQPAVLVAVVVFSVLTAVLAAGLGILISLRAATVRQAQQTLSLAMLVLLLIPILGSRLLTPASAVQLEATLSSLDPVRIAVIVAAVLLVIDALLLLAGLARFKRARLILD